MQIFSKLIEYFTSIDTETTIDEVKYYEKDDWTYIGEKPVYVPLPFWFSYNSGCALPPAYIPPLDKNDYALKKWANAIGHSLIKSIEIEVGGVTYKYENDWLPTYIELTGPKPLAIGYSKKQPVDLDVEYFNNETFNMYDEDYYGIPVFKKMNGKWNWYDEERPIIHRCPYMFSPASEIKESTIDYILGMDEWYLSDNTVNKYDEEYYQ